MTLNLGQAKHFKWFGPCQTNEMSARTEGTSWWLFLASSGFFVLGALRHGDLVDLIAAGLFAAACVVYLIGRKNDS
jgi:hypothetical protein